MLVTFEGIEGSGKSTLMEALALELAARGTNCVLTREPGGTLLGEALRAVFLDPASRISDLAEVFLLSAARAQHVAEVIRPALARQDAVLCDRFFDSTFAYQGYGRGLDLEMLIEQARTATGGLEPDLTFVLDLPVETARARLAQRQRRVASSDDRIEREDATFYDRVRAGYLALAQRFSRFVVLDAVKPVEVLREEALSALAARSA